MSKFQVCKFWLLKKIDFFILSKYSLFWNYYTFTGSYKDIAEWFWAPFTLSPDDAILHNYNTTPKQEIETGVLSVQFYIFPSHV